MDTQSEIMNYHSDFRIGSTFQSCSPISYISVTLPVYQMTNDSRQAEPKLGVCYLLISIGRKNSIVNWHCISPADHNLGRWTTDNSLMLPWVIRWRIRCCQHQNIMTSRDMQSYIPDTSQCKNQIIGAQSTQWTCWNESLFRPQLQHPGLMGLMIHKSWVARNTLCSIHGQISQLQTTAHFAPLKCSKI
jgi:hypothetical protein